MLFALTAALGGCSASVASGPAKPGHLNLAWSYRGATASAMQAIFYAGGPRLLIASVDGPVATGAAASSAAAIIAIDPATGRRRWMTYTGNQQATPVAATRSVIVAFASGAAESTAPPALWAFDVATGNEIWSKDLAATDLVAGVSDGNVVIANTASLTELSAATGAQVQRRNLPPGCSTIQASADDEIIGLVRKCPHGELRLLVTDATTGRTRWSNPVVSNYSSFPAGINISLDKSIVTATGNGSLTVYAASGKPVLIQQIDRFAGSWASGSGPNVLLAYEDPSMHVIAERVDGENGRIIRRFSAPYILSSAAFAGNIGYLTIQLPDPLLPTGLAIVNLQDGSHSLSALPGAGLPDIPLTPGNSLIFMVPALSSGAGVIAYQTTRTRQRLTFLQGSSPGRWPNACMFLSTAQLSAILHGAYTASESRLRMAGLPGASECDYTPTNPRNPLVSVSIRWISSLAASAATLLTDTTVGWSRVSGIGQQARQSSTTGRAPGTGRAFGEIMLREGRLIADVKINGSPSIRSVARMVARNLRQYRWATPTHRT